MRNRQLRARHLARATLPAQLAHSLDNQEDAAHSGMIGGKATAIRVDGKLPAERDAPILHERAPFGWLSREEAL